MVRTCEEHDGMAQSPEDLNRSISSPQSVVQDLGGKAVPENAVHVLTVSLRRKKIRTEYLATRDQHSETQARIDRQVDQ